MAVETIYVTATVPTALSSVMINQGPTGADGADAAKILGFWNLTELNGTLPPSPAGYLMRLNGASAWDITLQVATLANLEVVTFLNHGSEVASLVAGAGLTISGNLNIGPGQSLSIIGIGTTEIATIGGS